MIRVAVESAQALTPRTLTAPSIAAALTLAGGESSGARVVFPIDPDAFFVDPVTAGHAPRRKRRARPSASYEARPTLRRAAR